jgi:hypothetical protein
MDKPGSPINPDGRLDIGTHMYMSLPKTNTQNVPETSLTP